MLATIDDLTTQAMRARPQKMSGGHQQRVARGIVNGRTVIVTIGRGRRPVYCVHFAGRSVTTPSVQEAQRLCGEEDETPSFLTALGIPRGGNNMM